MIQFFFWMRSTLYFSIKKTLNMNALFDCEIVLEKEFDKHINKYLQIIITI